MAGKRSNTLFLFIVYCIVLTTYFSAECISCRRLQLLRLNDLRYVFYGFNEAAKEMNVEYWMDYGTLLGAVRNGMFVRYDHDIDLCFMESEREKVMSLSSPLRGRGMNLIIHPREKDSLQVFYKDVYIDFFSFRETKDGECDEYAACYLSYKNSSTIRRMSFPRDFRKKSDVFPVKEISMEGGMFSAPNNPEAVLNYQYRNDWNIEKLMKWKIIFMAATKRGALCNVVFISLVMIPIVILLKKSEYIWNLFHRRFS